MHNWHEKLEEKCGEEKMDVNREWKKSNMVREIVWNYKFAQELEMKMNWVGWSGVE